MNLNRGSEWNRWDLHIHTKDTNKNDQFKSDTFEAFCISMFKKAVEQKIAVIGITDYFCIENYKKVLEFQEKIDGIKELISIKKEVQRIYLIPNVELRMFPATNSGNLINIHCIFNPKYVDKLDNDFFNSLECSSGTKKHKMNKIGFIEKGKELGEENDEKALKKGIENFCVSYTDLQKLKDENKEFRDNTIIVVSNSNKDGASAFRQHYTFFENENGSLEGARQAIYKLSDMIFSSNNKDKEFFSGNKEGITKEDIIKKCGSLKPCIHGSDAHTEDKLFSPIENRYCWIKANLTFEGLKQIIYEPERVKIQEQKPQEALHKLDSIELQFDENTKWENDKFCFANFEETLYFSPYLTCIIGGRGSGKSTLLNLIANKIYNDENDENEFFNKLTEKNINSKIIFNPNAMENIEFLAQNEIEEFAKDSKKFTEAIFKRLDKKSNGNLASIEKNILESLKLFDEQIEFYIKEVELTEKLNKEKKDLEIFQNIVNTFSDKEYQSEIRKLKQVNKKISIIENSRDKFKSLYEKVKNIKEEYLEISEPQNQFDNYFNELYKNIEGIFEKFVKKDYESAKLEKKELEISQKEYLKKIEDYLKLKGMNEENIKDAQNASSKIEIIKVSIEQIKCDIKILRNKIDLFSLENIDTGIENFKTKIVEELNKINEKFEKISNENSEDVKEIKVEYELNENIFNKIFDQFLEISNLKNKFNFDKTTLSNYLQKIQLEEVLQCENNLNFKIMLEGKNIGTKTQTYNSMLEIFNSNLNFIIYKLLIQKNLRDIKNNKLLKVFYDSKTLDNTSFGQRCTAAIVILISLGNTPIIIDEPEAHLDSSLIANYLVELIKVQKQHRQIIFATHNANFVLNADAELIIKLENNSGVTESKSFAIEDIAYRDDLLKLEGGKEAFKKREKKYGI